jgi:exonuclease III
VDILCVQETWLAPTALPPTVAGYNITEERRNKGNRGGIAIYTKKQIAIEQALGNEYGLFLKITLPNSQRINVVNVYLPPTASLKRRDITEAQATSLLEDIIDNT